MIGLVISTFAIYGFLVGCSGTINDEIDGIGNEIRATPPEDRERNIQKVIEELSRSSN